MDFPEINLRITDEKECPLYDAGDEFCLSGTSLTMPADKQTCLILVRDITGIFGRAESLASQGSFYCGGCIGRIKISYKKEEEVRRPIQNRSDAELTLVADLLSKFDIFQNMNQRDVKSIITFLRQKKLKENDIVIRKGDAGRFFYIIASGRVEVLGDNNVSITYLGTGDVFGEMSLLSGDPVGATIRVTEPTRLLYLNRQDFLKLLNRYPSIQLFFARLLARRLASSNEARSEEFSSGMVGKLSEMPTPEILQTLNANQKSGILILELTRGAARLSFRDGQLVRAVYKDLEGKEAFFAVLQVKQGRFIFKPGLPEEEQSLKIIGDFMWLLMEGVRKMDEKG